MNKDQKQFLVGIGIVGYIGLTMSTLLNSIFDHSLIAQIAPIPFIVIPIIVAYIALGKKK